MADEQVFAVIGTIAAKEVDRHQRRITGITVTVPEFRDVDENNHLDYVCDVRIGSKENWEVVTDVLVAQAAYGIVNDINVPVTMERSEAGRLTIIARSEIWIPDEIVLDRFAYDELGFLFMTNLEQVDGVWQDGFGFPAATIPVGELGSTETCTFEYKGLGWGFEFRWGKTKWAETEVKKVCV